MNPRMPLRPAPDWRHSIVSRTSMAVAAIAMVGLIVIAASERIAERVQGSGIAINVAGSLRHKSHRLANLALTAEDAPGRQRVVAEIAAFDTEIASDTLRGAIKRVSSRSMDTSYEKVKQTWSGVVKPHILRFANGASTVSKDGPALIAEIDLLVSTINEFVEHLELDAENRIRQLRLTLAAALALILILLMPTLVLLHRRVALPMEQLVAGAERVARGDFESPIRYQNHDELGHLAESFNLMSSQLASLCGRMEQQVAAKTAELSRSNRSLKLLYDSISHLYNAPGRQESYRKVLDDLEEVLGLSGSMLCQLPKHGGSASILASSIGNCDDRSAEGCPRCPEFDGYITTLARRERLRPAVPARAGNTGPVLRVLRPDGSDTRLRQLALRDADHHYGVLRVLLEEHHELEEWQEMLLNAVAKHIGIALGISFQSERDRLVALQEERSTIARELHDSLAQSLSYMKIQASLLQPMLDSPENSAKARVVLGDLREGINLAYRQLRELLSTFRLRMEGDFLDLLNATVGEYSARSGVPITLETQLHGCHLTPNQEIHALHVIREALSNMTRHARAANASVLIEYREDGEVIAVIDDDGIGLLSAGAAPAGHHGTAIMKERALSLRGSVQIDPRPGGGTRVTLRFPATQPDTETPHEHA